MQSQLLTTLSPVPSRPAAPAELTSPRAFRRKLIHRVSSAAAAPQLTVAQSLACGAFARGVQILTMFPVDTIKTRMQIARSATAGAAGASSALSRALGQGNLYKGVTVSMVGQLPYAMLTFGLYEIVKSRVFDQPRYNLPSWLSIMLSASIGDAVGSLWLTPTEVIKSKTQAGLYPSPFAAIRGIAPSGLGAFYQGYTAALARDVPFRALQLYLFERVKTWYLARRARPRAGSEAGDDAAKAAAQTLTPVENLVVGAVSGTVTATLTTPFDVIRTRMMSQPSGQAALYGSALDCVVQTVRKEGAGAMLKGLGPRVVLIGPSSAVFFLAYEAIKTFFRNRSSQRKSVQAARVAPGVTPLRLRRGVRLRGGARRGAAVC